MDIPLSFLNDNQWYVATLYLDGSSAHWERNPMDYQINNFIVNKDTILHIPLVEGGGAAISIKPTHLQDLKQYKKYSEM